MSIATRSTLSSAETASRSRRSGARLRLASPSATSPASTRTRRPRRKEPTMRKVILMGAGGRDFHDFNVLFRADPETQVVAFTAAGPTLPERYPSSLAGPLLPGGNPIPGEDEVGELVRAENVDEVL